MKRILLLICLIGCDERPRGTLPDGSPARGKFSKCEFEGHSYITYSEGWGGARVGGLEHDPECPKCR